MLAALPLAVLGVLVAGGALPWQPGLVAGLVIAAGAVVLARLWVRDLVRILQALHRWHPDAPPAGEDPGRPLLSATAHVARAVERLVEDGLAREAALAERVRAEQGLVQRLPDPLITLDAARRVQRANAAAMAAVGTGLGAVLRHPGLRGALDRAQATGEAQAAALSLPAPTGRELEATVLPLHPPLADGGCFAVVLADRTRERAVERMRADFVANASHELRTPLTSLIGFIGTLQGPAADDRPAQERFLAIMAAQAERMNRLIDDLLSLSRIELVEHQVPRERVAVAAVLHRVAAAFEPRLLQRRIRLELLLPPDGTVVAGDEDQLDQVMQNLVDNAVKYGREGGTVRVEAREAPGMASGVASGVGGGTVGSWPARPGVVITVADDGAGVQRAHLPRLTERFYRADKHRSRAVGGTGLGLAIVKHIVNRHQGRMSIESTEGEGTAVTVWLPALFPPPGPGESGGGGRA